MPSILEDPTTKIPPPPSHTKTAPNLQPLHTNVLRHNNAPVTLYPITSGPGSLPADLVHFLHAQFAAEIERGCTYPMEEVLGVERFAEYWFGTFGVVAVLDHDEGEEGEGNWLREGRDWERVCLGTFYVKPNYPGSSHLSHLP